MRQHRGGRFQGWAANGSEAPQLFWASSSGCPGQGVAPVACSTTGSNHSLESRAVRSSACRVLREKRPITPRLQQLPRRSLKAAFASSSASPAAHFLSSPFPRFPAAQASSPVLHFNPAKLSHQATNDESRRKPVRRQSQFRELRRFVCNHAGLRLLQLQPQCGSACQGRAFAQGHQHGYDHRRVHL